MKFVSIRDLRNKSGQLFKELPNEKEMVITRNGRPVAIISTVSESNFEESLSAIRRSKSIEAVISLQQQSVEQETDKISLTEIETEIKAVRKKRSK